MNGSASLSSTPCPINQSIPEKYFNTLDCEIATTKRRAYLIGITKGDIVVHYVGPRRNEIRDLLLIIQIINTIYHHITCELLINMVFF